MPSLSRWPLLGTFLVLAACWRAPADPETLLFQAVATTKRAVTTCQQSAVIASESTAWRSEAAPFTAAEIARSCGDLEPLYDAHRDALLGTSRGAAWFLGSLARLGDDAEVLRETTELEKPPAHRMDAHEHLVGSLRDFLEHLDKATLGGTGGFEVNYAPPTGARTWERHARGDGEWIERLNDAVDRYALNQGLQPDLVRRRALDVAHGIAHAELLGREQGLTAGDPRAVHLAALRAYLTEVRAVIDAYIGGAVTSHDVRSSWVARLQAASTKAEEQVQLTLASLDQASTNPPP